MEKTTGPQIGETGRYITCQSRNPGTESCHWNDYQAKKKLWFWKFSLDKCESGKTAGGPLIGCSFHEFYLQKYPPGSQDKDPGKILYPGNRLSIWHCLEHSAVLGKSLPSRETILPEPSWTIKKAERQRIDAFEPWCWRRLLRVSWTARRSVLSVHWKDWCWSWNSNTLATWCEELTHLKRPWCWERLRAGGEGDNRRWDG